MQLRRAGVRATLGARDDSARKLHAALPTRARALTAALDGSLTDRMPPAVRRLNYALDEVQAGEFDEEQDEAEWERLIRDAFCGRGFAPRAPIEAGQRPTWAERYQGARIIYVLDGDGGTRGAPALAVVAGGEGRELPVGQAEAGEAIYRLFNATAGTLNAARHSGRDVHHRPIDARLDAGLAHDWDELERLHGPFDAAASTDGGWAKQTGVVTYGGVIGFASGAEATLSGRLEQSGEEDLPRVTAGAHVGPRHLASGGSSLGHFLGQNRRGNDGRPARASEIIQ